MTAQTTVSVPNRQELIDEFATALTSADLSDAAAPGTPAAAFLEYVNRSRRLRNLEPLELVSTSDSGFVVSARGVEIHFSDISVSNAGVEDLSVYGGPVSERIAAVASPVETRGIIVESGFSYMLDWSRSLLFTVTNRSGVAVVPRASKSGFVQNDGTLMSRHIGFTADPIPPGATADLIFSTREGNSEAEGLMKFLFVEVDSQIEHVVSVPFGGADPTFFRVDEDGSIQGFLSSDTAFGIPGSSDLSAVAVSILSSAAEELISLTDPETKICVAGHAYTPRPEEANLTYSRDLAAAVAEQFEAFGVSNDLEVVGYGGMFKDSFDQEDASLRRVDVSLEACG